SPVEATTAPTEGEGDGSSTLGGGHHHQGYGVRHSPAGAAVGRGPPSIRDVHARAARTSPMRRRGASVGRSLMSCRAGIGPLLLDASGSTSGTATVPPGLYLSLFGHRG